MKPKKVKCPKCGCDWEKYHYYSEEEKQWHCINCGSWVCYEPKDVMKSITVYVEGCGVIRQGQPCRIYKFINIPSHIDIHRDYEKIKEKSLRHLETDFKEKIRLTRFFVKELGDTLPKLETHTTEWLNSEHTNQSTGEKVRCKNKT